MSEALAGQEGMGIYLPVDDRLDIEEAALSRGINPITLDFLETAARSDLFSCLSAKQHNVLTIYYGSNFTLCDVVTLDQREIITAFLYSAASLLHAGMPTREQEVFPLNDKLILKQRDLEAKASLERSQKMKKLWQNNAYRARISKKRQETWQDPEYRAAMTGNMQRVTDPVFQAEVREKNRLKWQDPEYRERMEALRIKQWDEPARTEQAQRMRLKWQDPEYRERMREIRQQQMKIKWQDPEYRQQMEQMRRNASPRTMSEQARQNISNGLKGKPKSDEHRARISQALRERAAKRRSAQKN